MSSMQKDCKCCFVLMCNRTNCHVAESSKITMPGLALVFFLSPLFFLKVYRANLLCYFLPTGKSFGLFDMKAVFFLPIYLLNFLFFFFLFMKSMLITVCQCLGISDLYIASISIIFFSKNTLEWVVWEHSSVEMRYLKIISLGPQFLL